MLVAAYVVAPVFTYQSGLLYWCSATESGANFAYNNIATNEPRTYWGVNSSPSSYTEACHNQGIQTNNQAYTFTNGTAYPTNVGASVYAVSPSPCQVSQPTLMFHDLIVDSVMDMVGRSSDAVGLAEGHGRQHGAETVTHAACTIVQTDTAMLLVSPCCSSPHVSPCADR